MILSSAVFMIEKYKSPVGDGNVSFQDVKKSTATIEKYKSPVGDGNGFKPACEVKTGTIEKYKSPVGDGNPYAIFKVQNAECH